MATSTEPEGAPPAAKGTKGETNRKRSSEQGEGGQGGAGSGGGGWQKRKKKKEVFIYGNYKNYYGYRVSAKLPPFVLSPLELLLFGVHAWSPAVRRYASQSVYFGPIGLVWFGLTLKHRRLNLHP
jgi:hypothetical protein